MFDKQPLPTDSARQWYLHFSMSKDRILMGERFNQAVTLFKDDTSAIKNIRTGFLAARINAIWREFPSIHPRDMPDELTGYCGVSPTSFIGVKCRDIEELISPRYISWSAADLLRRLITIGFTVDAHGTIVGHHSPAPPRGQPPRIQPLKPS
jgi:hypothetical protein